MAKVTGPFFSPKASGSFGNTLVIRCGSVMTKKIMGLSEPLDDLSFQQLRFKQGAALWKGRSIKIDDITYEGLTSQNREEWKQVGVIHALSPACLFLPVILLLTAITNPQGGIVLTSTAINIIFATFHPSTYQKTIGYQLWMGFYLKLGVDSWPNYPAPPPSAWSYTEN